MDGAIANDALDQIAAIGLTSEALERSLDVDFRPIFRRLLNTDELKTEAALAAKVLAAIQRTA